MRHVTYRNIHKCAMSHTGTHIYEYSKKTSHIARVNKSRHTCKCVTSPISCHGSPCRWCRHGTDTSPHSFPSTATRGGDMRRSFLPPPRFCHIFFRDTAQASPPIHFSRRLPVRGGCAGLFLFFIFQEEKGRERHKERESDYDHWVLEWHRRVRARAHTHTHTHRHTHTHSHTNAYISWLSTWKHEQYQHFSFAEKLFLRKPHDLTKPQTLHPKP